MKTEQQLNSLVNVLNGITVVARKNPLGSLFHSFAALALHYITVVLFTEALLWCVVNKAVDK